MSGRVVEARAADGQLVRGRLVGTAAAADVVFLPALGVPIAYYEPLLQAWAARGRTILGVEYRGMPLSPRGPGTGAPGYSTLIRQDVPAILASPHVVPEGLLLTGHSMGGALALLGTAAGLVRPRLVATIATGTSWCGAEHGTVRRARRRIAIATVSAVTGALGFWPGDLLGFAGRQPAPMMRDWAYEAVHNRFRLDGDDLDFETALRGLDAPHLLVGLSGDHLISPRAVALLARRTGPAGRRVHLELELDHFRWARTAPGPVIDAVEGWASAA